jgi:PHD/YefM family antitoxin component YafN of YafNO toxin-antitoxin module
MSTAGGTMLNTIPASEIKRRGISAVDELRCDGPVHVIKNDRPTYVILSEEDFDALVENKREAYVARVKASLAEVAEGKVIRGSVEDLIAMLYCEDDSEDACTT